MLLVFADFVPPDRIAAVDATGLVWKQVTTTDDIDRLEPEDKWQGAYVHLPERGLQSASAVCRALRERSIPVLAALSPDWMDLVRTEHTWFDDFVSTSASVDELQLRVSAFIGTGRDGDAVAYGPVTLDLCTYQARVGNQLLDLTYMEYELLRWFVNNPDRVFSREELLREVWKYDYYGGARTVDVHVRRLRSKMGREHAHLIQTIRSVGYLFGNARCEG